MKKPFANTSLLYGPEGEVIGYSVQICDSAGEPVLEYDAGDCRADSQVYGTGEIEPEELMAMAEQTAGEMLKELNQTKSKGIN